MAINRFKGIFFLFFSGMTYLFVASSKMYLAGQLYETSWKEEIKFDTYDAIRKL